MFDRGIRAGYANLFGKMKANGVIRYDSDQICAVADGLFAYWGSADGVVLLADGPASWRADDPAD